MDDGNNGVREDVGSTSAGPPRNWENEHSGLSSGLVLKLEEASPGMIDGDRIVGPNIGDKNFVTVIYDSTNVHFSSFVALAVRTKGRYSNGGRRDMEPLGD